MSKTLVPKDISDHPLANALEPVLNEVLENQTWFQRRKNTIFAVAQGVVQVANLSFFIVGDLPWQVALAIGLVAFLAEAVLHSRTKGPLTVSRRLSIRSPEMLASILRRTEFQSGTSRETKSRRKPHRNWWGFSYAVRISWPLGVLQSARCSQSLVRCR